MKERDCANCKHHTEDGCSSWDCEFEAKDLISRADVLKFPIRLDHYDEEHGNRDFVLGIESVMEYVESLPSADAVQGEWIWRTDIPIGDGRTSAGYICSHCGKDYWHGNKLKFCPNCGAIMKGYNE